LKTAGHDPLSVLAAMPAATDGERVKREAGTLRAIAQRKVDLAEVVPAQSKARAKAKLFSGGIN
jgi:hypothetical protein